ncbi:MAG: fumarate reductase [Chloroflexi bacterium]|nr:fumarate reductase [Chloroflexota bacterium]
MHSQVATSDILVVGGGIAGAFAAIKARETGADVVLVDKAFFGRGGASALASGVYATYMPGDDMENRLAATCTAPHVNRRLAERFILRTYECLMDMDGWGVKWIKEDGVIARRMSGGGGTDYPTNAMMAEGGPQMMMALRGHALREGVRVINRVMITDLLTSDGAHPTGGAIVGAVGIHTRTAEPWVFRARATIICAGAFAFPYTPVGSFQGMPQTSSGDGVAAMFRAGATMGKFEFGGGGMRPSEFFCAPGLEMLGGLGCRFINDAGEDMLSLDRSQGKYTHEDITRGRRSALGNALIKEAEAGRVVYLDARHFTADEHRLVKQVVPIVVNTFERAGYDLSKDVVPYRPTPPGSNGNNGGGARVNERGETSLSGLYAAGNCSDAAYISMGQSLPACSVTGAWAGESAADFVRGAAATPPDPEQVDELIERALAPLQREDGASFPVVHELFQRMYLEEMGNVLHAERLERALSQAEAIRTEELPRLSASDPHDLAKVNALKNFAEMLAPALTVLLRRQESRGNILREDYPFIDNENWGCYTVFRRRPDGGTDFWEEPIPEDAEYPVARVKTGHPFFR